jgi:hypothetical protein
MIRKVFELGVGFRSETETSRGFGQRSKQAEVSVRDRNKQRFRSETETSRSFGQRPKQAEVSVRDRNKQRFRSKTETSRGFCQKPKQAEVSVRDRNKQRWFSSLHLCAFAPLRLTLVPKSPFHFPNDSFDL